MKIFVDENIPKITVNLLEEVGHDVRDIRGTNLEGMEDEGIWDLIQQEGRLLITTDKGFMKYRNNKHKGKTYCTSQFATVMYSDTISF